MKQTVLQTTCIIAFLFLSFTTFAQNNFFRTADEAAVKTSAKRVIVPKEYKVLQLDIAGFTSFFSVLPQENKLTNKNMAPVISIPMPDGTTADFRIWESSAMAPELAAANPNIKTFTGQGITDPTATIKLDWTEFGFHAMILSPVTGSVFIDPYDQQTVINYISYFKKDLQRTGRYYEPEIKKVPVAAKPANVLAGVCTGTQLRTYRLAVACTHQYATAATGLANPTKSQTLAKIVTTVNRVNGVYEKEVAIRIVLVANNTNVVFVSAATDPFKGNDDANTLIDESQKKIDSAIGNANYDIGHTFSTGAGGLAGLGVVCSTGEKASGVTGSNVPVGDPYDIDYVAHEMGHQFGADHTFNSNLGFCAGNEAIGFNAEPGSGTTIMAYAGICDADNIRPNSDAQFHGISFDEITNYTINNTGNGCAVKTATSNAAPVANAGASYIIPVSTPFVLTGSATDANGDALTYSWEQVDVGGPVGAWNAPSGDAPLFRSFPPTTSPSRDFPKLSTQVKNVDSIGELKPTYARTMHFRLTARDNKAGGGGVCNAQTAVTTSSTTGPFLVTFPNTAGLTLTAGDFQTIKWNVAGTNGAPINCANVSIQLSTDGGLTFPVTVLASTPNDGKEEVIVPNNVTANARIRVIAVGNIFYDLSDVNFTIQAPAAPSFIFNSPDTVSVCGAASGVTTIKTSGLSGFSTTIALTTTLTPAGGTATVGLGTTSLAPGGSTTVTLNNANTLTAGLYTIRITGTAGSTVKTRDIQFVVGAPAAPSTLSAPANDATGVTTKPTFNWGAVPGAISYILEISASSNFSTIRQTISNINPPYTLTNSLGEDTIYYWRLKTINGCGTGTAGKVSNRFRTGLTVCGASNTYTSTNVPKVIKTDAPDTVYSTLTVPAGSNIKISDLNVVGLTGTHTYINDLTITLTSPAGTTVKLFGAICSQDENFNLNLDEQSSTTDFPCPPIGGVTVKPMGALSAFNGQNTAGVWTLTVIDGYANDGGSLTGWGITATPCTFTATPLATTYTFTGNGSWSNAANWASNTIPPSTLPSGAIITINHAAGGQCLLDIPQHISAGASLVVLTGKNLVVQGALNIQ